MPDHRMPPAAAGRTIDAAARVLKWLGAILAAIALGSALAGIQRGHRRPATPIQGLGSAVGTPVALSASTIGFIGASVMLWRRLPIALGPWARGLSAGAGGLAMFLGLGLYLRCMAALGPAYNVSSTLGARLYRGQRLVTSGPYAVVRHPMYVGLMFVAVGGLLLYRTWATLAFVALLPVLVVRARREEAALAGQFKDAWVEYCDDVPAWIPRHQ